MEMLPKSYIYNKKDRNRKQIKSSLSNSKYLLNLQKMYEEGKILEKELTYNQKKQLEKLYDEQISELNIKIYRKRKELIKITSEVNNSLKKAIENK